MDDFIRIRGARQHNLKNVSLDLPRRAFTVITGPSGSGKSSLALDTLFAEGQRRYVESLSTYAKQFLDRMEKPLVDAIEGLCPAVAIEQRNPTKTSRSTVGTATEVYDYLRLLWARVGTTHCPECGREVRPDTVSGTVDHLLALAPGLRFQVAFPLRRSEDVGHARLVEGFGSLASYPKPRGTVSLGDSEGQGDHPSEPVHSSASARRRACSKRTASACRSPDSAALARLISVTGCVSVPRGIDSEVPRS